MTILKFRARIIVALLGTVAILASVPTGATPLDDYVNAPDATFSYELLSTPTGPGYTGYIYTMNSQTWRNAQEVDRPVWQHWVKVVVPDTLTHDKAMMFISGGSNGGAAPTTVDAGFAAIAVASQAVVVEIRMIPNERIRFLDETDYRYKESGRTEDEMIAYTWDKYAKTDDATWLARLPMTKAVVRAMDLAEAEHDVTGFFVSGGSKRGWTTWTTAAVDARVEAIAPIVIDVLNVEASMQHHYDAYGDWSLSIQDYADMGLMDKIHDPDFRKIMDVVDPYVYRDRLTMPKFIMNSTGDQFFLPDSSQFYFDDLVGEKHIRFLPNTDHGVDSPDTLKDLATYFESYLNDVARPEFTWDIQPDGSIRVETETTPTAVHLWKATNPEARDFRQETIGNTWTSTPLTAQSPGVYVGSVPEPALGWSAFFIELEFESGLTYPFQLTTQVSVVPDILPYENGNIRAEITNPTALDDYVAAPDANYSYELLHQTDEDGYTSYVYAMTSQSWRSASEVDRPLWQHWLMVAVPDVHLHDDALIWIGGRDNDDPAPAAIREDLGALAASTLSIVAEVRMIPNQELLFADETDPRYLETGREEDELIAYAWDKFRDTKDPLWLPRLPMTKAVVRAMDTIQSEFTSVQGFMAAGESKRGWTTWTVAAVDPRIKAIAPHVIDLLNIVPSFQHHYAAYGEWADAVQDYVDMEIFEWYETQDFQDLLNVVGPYTYRDRYTMPKFIVNASGDEFFLPDSSQFYFDDLVGQKYLRYVPNAGHGLNDDAFTDFTAYYGSYLFNTPRPQFSWEKTPEGQLVVDTVTQPTRVLLWQSTNPTARNFIQATYTSTVLQDQGNGRYVTNMPEPTNGWTAFFIELEYPNGKSYPVGSPLAALDLAPFKFTTEVSVIPDILPFATQENCVSIARSIPSGCATPASDLVVTVTIDSNCSTDVTAVGVREFIPAGWSLVATGGATPPDAHSAFGTEDTVEFVWLNLDTFPATFTYTLRVADNASTSQTISGVPLYRLTGGELTGLSVETAVCIEGSGGEGEGEGDTTPPVITLLGGTSIDTECSIRFIDPGATAVDAVDGNLSNMIVVSGDTVTTDSPGIYTLRYTVQDRSGNVAVATRSVFVRDTVGPVITLVGSEQMTLDCSGSFVEPGVSAIDSCAGEVNVTSSGTVNSALPGQYFLTYNAVDSSGNSSQRTRVVTVRENAPQVTLLGDAVISIPCGTPFVDPGATAVDACDGIIAYRTDIEVDGNVPGTFVITYVSTDRTGRTGTASRTVHVVDTEGPAMTLMGPETVIIDCGTSYSEPGVEVEDNCDPAPVLTSNADTTLNRELAGTYVITYTAEDSAGNVAMITRTVLVQGTGCNGAQATCPLATFTIDAPPGDIVVPQNVTAQPVSLRASASFGQSTGTTACAEGTVEVTYMIGTTTLTSLDRAGNFPATVMLAPGEHQVTATAHLLETGATLADSRVVIVRTAADVNNDGLVDQVFTNLSDDGDLWMAETSHGNGMSNVQMIRWNGDCTTTANDLMTLRIANPDNPNQIVTVSIPRELLNCGEQGIALLQMASSAVALLGLDVAGTVPMAPAGQITGTPYFSFSVLVSNNGGQTFGPLGNNRLAATPISVRLSGLSGVVTGTTITGYPMEVSNDGAGNLALSLPDAAWTSTLVSGVTADSTSIQASTKGAALFTAVLPETTGGGDGTIACSPSQRMLGGRLWGDMLLVGLLMALWLVVGNRQMAGSVKKK